MSVSRINIDRSCAHANFFAFAWLLPLHCCCITFSAIEHHRHEQDGIRSLHTDTRHRAVDLTQLDKPPKTRENPNPQGSKLPYTSLCRELSRGDHAWRVCVYLTRDTPRMAPTLPKFFHLPDHVFVIPTASPDQRPELHHPCQSNHHRNSCAVRCERVNIIGTHAVLLRHHITCPK